jgi:hypothetical protein
VTGQRRLITEAPEDREQIRRLYTHAHEHDHVLCVVPTPGRRGEGIGRDLLRALGKRFDRPRTPRDPQRLLELAGIWLNAHGITTVIVRHADRLSIESWREICSVLPGHTDLWLWAEPSTLTPAHQRVSRELDMSTGSLEALQSRLAYDPPRQHPVARLADQIPTPTAPDADYALFAIASQAPGNETLFANFLLGREHALWHLDKIERRPHEASVNRLLAHVAHCAADDEAAIARARGAQMQLLLAGIHTSIDPEPLRALVTTHNLSRPDLHAARLLSGYVQPIPAATAAACLASGRGPDWLATLAPEQIGAGQIGDYRVPRHLQPPVSLLALEHDLWLDHGATDPRRLRRTLDVVTRQTGLRFARDSSPWHRMHHRVEVSYM